MSESHALRCTAVLMAEDLDDLDLTRIPNGTVVARLGGLSLTTVQGASLAQLLAELAVEVALFEASEPRWT